VNDQAGRSVIVPASVVRYLRDGVKQEMLIQFELLRIYLTTSIDPEGFHNAFACLDEARALFEDVGIIETEPVELALSLSPLVCRIVQREYETVRMRVEDADAEGFPSPSLDLPVLEALVAQCREQSETPRPSNWVWSRLTRQRDSR
jgi:hypothetical protein